MLTCALVAACGDDDAGTGPMLAPTVPNADASLLPGLGGDVVTIDAATEESQVVVAVDIDPAVTADSWTIQASYGLDTVVTETFSDRTHEMVITAPPNDPGSELAISLSGSTLLSGGSTYYLARRVAKTKFTPGAKKLAYFFIDSFCAYTSDAFCSNPDETCADGKCRPQELGALPDYYDDWRTNPPNPCHPDEPPSLEFGEGFDTFTPKNDGDEVTLQCGTQGGNHVWVALRMRGMSQNDVTLTFTSDTPDGGIAYPTTVVRRFDNSCQDVGEQYQVYGVGSVPALYLGQPITITATAEDPAGRKATVSRRVKIAQKLSSDTCGQP